MREITAQRKNRGRKITAYRQGKRDRWRERERREITAQRKMRAREIRGRESEKIGRKITAYSL